MKKESLISRLFKQMLVLGILLFVSANSAMAGEQAYYDFYNKGYRIDLRKIKGHVGHKYNELADKLATGKISEEEAIKIYG